MNTQKNISKIISVLAHPLLIPTYAFLILENYAPLLMFLNFKAKVIISLFIFITTFVLPLAGIPLLRLLKMLKYYRLDEKRERIIPLFITFIFYNIAYYYLKNINAPSFHLVKTFLISSTLVLFITMLISIRWKISAHLIGAGGLIGMLIAIWFRFPIDILSPLMIFVFVAGLLGYARLILRKHHPAQVYSSFIIGFVIVLLTMTLL